MNSVSNIVKKLRESRESQILNEEYISVEYTYNGDEISDYLGYVNVKASSESEALKGAKLYAMNKHPEQEPRHFVIADTEYTNADRIDKKGNLIKESAEDMPSDEDYEAIDRSGSDEDVAIAALTYMYGKPLSVIKKEYAADDYSEEEIQKAIKYYHLRDLPTSMRLKKMEEAEEDEGNAEYREFMKKCQANPTWKKANAICEKYGYKLSPIASVEVYPSGRKVPSVNFLVDHTKKYNPTVYYYAGKFGNNTPTMEIQTTAHGSLTLEEHAEFLESVTNAHKMVEELSKIDFMTLYQDEVDY